MAGLRQFSAFCFLGSTHRGDNQVAYAQNVLEEVWWSRMRARARAGGKSNDGTAYTHEEKTRMRWYEQGLIIRSR